MRTLTGALATGTVYSAFALLRVGTAKPDPVLTILCGLLLAAALVVVAQRMPWRRGTQFRVWFGLLFLNLAAVAVEGTLFAPGAAPPAQLVLNLLRLLVASIAVAAVVAVWYGRDVGVGIGTPPARPLSSWLWRLAAVVGVYLVLYFVVGGINYTLVTQPYYASHAGSLTVPPAQVMFVYEPIRGLLIGLSVLPLILGMPTRPGVAAVVAGAMLFVVGGLAPLLPQSSLPLYLRVASLWEIFGQNFLTGVACAYLFLGWRRSRSNLVPPPSPSQQLSPEESAWSARTRPG